LREFVSFRVSSNSDESLNFGFGAKTCSEEWIRIDDVDDWGSSSFGCLDCESVLVAVHLIPEAGLRVLRPVIAERVHLELIVAVVVLMGRAGAGCVRQRVLTARPRIDVRPVSGEQFATMVGHSILNVASLVVGFGPQLVGVVVIVRNRLSIALLD
jgi:hypothetical protein